MSTSDAGELELRVVGGETAAPLYGTAPATRTTAAREHQDETFGESFKQENHLGNEAQAEQRCDRSAIRQEETHKALILGDRPRKDEASHRGDSDVRIQKPTGPRFSSCLFLRLSSNLGLNQPEPRLKRNLDPCLLSLIEPRRDETKDSSFQANGRASPDISIATTSTGSLAETFPAKKEEEVFAVAANELDIPRDLSITHNDNFGLHECKGLHAPPIGSQPRTCTGFLTGVELKEEIKDSTKLKHQTDLGDLSDPSLTMLSSTVVTVLAPHWSTRLRRTKRFDGTGNSEPQGNLQDVANTTANREVGFQETHSQHGGERMMTDGLQAQPRVPFLGPRRNTVGWSTKSDPSSLDYESKREMTHTVSLDVNSGRMDNRKTDTGALSPLPTTTSPVSPRFLDPNEQRRNPQTGHQGHLSSLSSKPTTSSLLLSLRKFNSNGRNSEVNPSPLSSSPNDRNAKIFTTHLSQTFLNNNDPESPKPLLSPASISYRTTETGPVLSPSSSRERSTSDTLFFSTSPINRDAEGVPFTQQPQTIKRTQSSFTSSKQPFLSKGSSERHQTCRGSDKSTDLFSEASVSSPRHSPYDRTALLKNPSSPKRTTLTSTSWWKQVTQEGTGTIKDKPNTPLVPPCSNNNSDMPSPSRIDNKRLGSPIPNNRDNNNTTESVCKGNMNLVMKTQGGTHNLKQRNAENSPERKSDRLVKQQYGSNLNNREPQKPLGVPGVLSSSKISRAVAQTALSHLKDPSKYDVSNGSFTANVTELPPTLLNPRSSNTPTESSSKYKNTHCIPKTNNTPVSPHNMDSQKFIKPSLSPDFTTTLNSQALASQTTSGLSPNGNSSFSFHSHPLSPQTSIHTTPLGFERSYASVSKPFHPKTVSGLVPTVSPFSKTNYSPVSTAATTFSSTTGSHPVATAAPSPSLLSPPVTPALASSPTSIPISSLLTPPATPVITSPSSEASSPKGGKTFSSSPERDPKKHPGVEGKRLRRVTWEDSVDLQSAPTTKVEKPDSSPVQTNPLSPSRFPRSTPSIFSFLRSGSPTRNTSPFCSPSPKTSSIQAGKGGKYRSLSSDSAELASREHVRNKQRTGDTMMFDQGRQDVTTPRQERTLSVESGTVQCRSSAPLSLPPDFSSDYKLRYSSPPYSTLMSSRLAHGETKTMKPRSQLFSQPSQSSYSPQLSSHTDQVSVMTLSTSKPPLSPIRPSQSLSLSLPFQRKPATQESAKCVASQTDQMNNNHSKSSGHARQNSQILLVNNRVSISSQSLPGDMVPNSTYVTETLVYSIKSKVDTTAAAPKDTTPKALQHTANTAVSVETKLSQQSNTVQSKKAAGELCSHSDQSSSGSSSTGSQSRDGESCSRRVKESVLGKSRFFSVEGNNEQSPKRSRFALKKSVSTPNSSLPRSESERANKSNNKMDQVFNKLRQKFSPRRSEDDSSFPWKWKRASQTPSVSGSSDVSNVSVESTKTLEERVQEKGLGLNDNNMETEGTNRWTQNRYTIVPPSAVVSTTAGDQFSICSPTLEPEQDDGTDYKATNQFLSCRDPSPGKSPSPSAAYPAQFRKSTSSPRSPFSPFSSLSPVSPFSSPDVTDDSVFYSPKLQRRRESPSPCEPGEGMSLGGSRRSRASTGPPSISPVQDNEQLASSYADLKYGIEPGRSFSVSSVLSSRPSGPGRISTGSRFMSVGDLSQPALSCGGSGRDLDHWSVTPDLTTEFNRQPTGDCQMSYFPSDPGKMRSRSLPRSLTRCLANWSSGDSPYQPITATTSKPTRLWSPNMNTSQFAWDTEGPPTPPPTPPLSPVSRRMSQPPSLSPPTFPSSSGAPQQVDSQSSRGHLPSKGYVSSLSTFEESSDSSSDTTTDDEYYLETDEDGDKETEL